MKFKNYRNTKYRKQIPPLPLPPESVMEFTSVDIKMIKIWGDRQLHHKIGSSHTLNRAPNQVDRARDQVTLWNDNFTTSSGEPKIRQLHHNLLYFLPYRSPGIQN